MADPTATTEAAGMLLQYGPGGLIALLAIAWGTQQRADATTAKAEAAAARLAKDALGERYVADVAKLTEQLALSREQDRRTEVELAANRAALERSGAHRIVP